MDLGLQDKVTLIGGGSRGIGRAVAARGEEALRQTAAEAGAAGVQVLAVPCDLLRAEDAERFVSAAAERFGRIDALVNSIHFSAPGDGDDVWKQSFDTLFLPAARLTRL